MACRNTYIAYSKDDIYELPMYVGNAKQLARFIGCSRSAITTANYRDSIIHKKYKVDMVRL